MNVFAPCQLFTLHYLAHTVLSLFLFTQIICPVHTFNCVVCPCAVHRYHQEFFVSFFPTQVESGSGVKVDRFGLFFAGIGQSKWPNLETSRLFSFLTRLLGDFSSMFLFKCLVYTFLMLIFHCPPYSSCFML